MKAIKWKIIAGVVTSLIVGFFSHVGYILFVSFPKVEAKTEQITEIKGDIKELKHDMKEVLKRLP